jgi:hypothetical protein
VPSTQSPSASPDAPYDPALDDPTERAKAKAASPQGPSEPPETPRHNAMLRAAKADEPGDLSAEQVQDATDWFLADDEEEVPVNVIEINVGVAKPKWVRWTVRAIDRDRIRQLREQATNRAGRRSGGAPDDMRVNLLIATEGSVVDWTDERMLAYKKKDGTPGKFIDPVDAIRYRFRFKPGLIDQIAGEVLSTSGYDDEDVREVAAAGN